MGGLGLDRVQAWKPAHRAELPSFHEISPDQYRLSTGTQWKTFFLLGFGVPSPLTQELCPATMRALECVPEGDVVPDPGGTNPDCPDEVCSRGGICMPSRDPFGDPPGQGRPQGEAAGKER